MAAQNQQREFYTSSQSLFGQVGQGSRADDESADDDRSVATDIGDRVVGGESPHPAAETPATPQEHPALNLLLTAAEKERAEDGQGHTLGPSLAALGASIGDTNAGHDHEGHKLREEHERLQAEIKIQETRDLGAEVDALMSSEKIDAAYGINSMTSRLDLKMPEDKEKQIERHTSKITRRAHARRDKKLSELEQERNDLLEALEQERHLLAKKACRVRIEKAQAQSEFLRTQLEREMAAIQAAQTPGQPPSEGQAARLFQLGEAIEAKQAELDQLNAEATALANQNQVTLAQGPDGPLAEDEKAARDALIQVFDSERDRMYQLEELERANGGLVTPRTDQTLESYQIRVKNFEAARKSGEETAAKFSRSMTTSQADELLEQLTKLEKQKIKAARAVPLKTHELNSEALNAEARRRALALALSSCDQGEVAPPPLTGELPTSSDTSSLQAPKSALAQAITELSPADEQAITQAGQDAVTLMIQTQAQAAGKRSRAGAVSSWLAGKARNGLSWTGVCLSTKTIQSQAEQAARASAEQERREQILAQKRALLEAAENQAKENPEVRRQAAERLQRLARKRAAKKAVAELKQARDDAQQASTHSSLTGPVVVSPPRQLAPAFQTGDGPGTTITRLFVDPKVVSQENTQLFGKVLSRPDTKIEQLPNGSSIVTLQSGKQFELVFGRPPAPTPAIEGPSSATDIGPRIVGGNHLDHPATDSDHEADGEASDGGQPAKKGFDFGTTTDRRFRFSNHPTGGKTFNFGSCPTENYLALSSAKRDS